VINPLTLDALTHAQEFLVVTPASSIQVALPSACIDRLFQLVLTVCEWGKKVNKFTYGKERYEFSKSFVARFDSQRVGLRPQEGSDDTLLANLEDGLRSIFESPEINHKQSLLDREGHFDTPLEFLNALSDNHIAIPCCRDAFQPVHNQLTPLQPVARNVPYWSLPWNKPCTRVARQRRLH
jgi:hypothetical protein